MHSFFLTKCVYLVALFYFCFAAAPENGFCSHTYFSESFAQDKFSSRDTLGKFSKSTMNLVLSNTPYTNIAHPTKVGTFNDNDLLTISAPSFCQQLNEKLHTGDANGDGYDDLICWRADGSFSVRVFENPNFGVEQKITGFTCTIGGSIRALFGDYDGDGVVDILCIDSNNYASILPHVYLGGKCERNDVNLQAVQQRMSPIRPSDILRSQMNLGGYSSNHFKHHKSLICKGITMELTSNLPCTGDSPAGIGDINGDGKDDIVCISANFLYYHLATGNRAALWSAKSNPTTGSDTCDLSSNTLQVGNIDSTPREEILCIPYAGGFIGVFYYDYQDLLQKVPVSAPPCEEFCSSSAADVVFFTGDFNGDDAADIMCRYTASSGNEITEIMYAEAK